MTRAALALLLGASAVAQQPTFRTTTELVRIDALV
jgi:hypothetical protein